MSKSSYENYRDIAKDIILSGYCPENFIQTKRVYDYSSNGRYVEQIDEDKTIFRLCLTMERGAEMGLSAIQSLYSIVWFAGRPCIYGDVALAMCKAHPSWSGMSQNKKFDCDRIDWECTTIIVRNGYEHKGEFSWRDAIDAGLARLPHYQEYGKRMLSMRSRIWALRDAFPDILSGISIAEEMKDFDMVSELNKSEKKVSEQISASAAMDKFTQAAIAEKGDVKPDLDAAMSHKFDHEKDKFESSLTNEQRKEIDPDGKVPESEWTRNPFGMPPLKTEGGACLAFGRLTEPKKKRRKSKKDIAKE